MSKNKKQRRTASRIAKVNEELTDLKATLVQAKERVEKTHGVERARWVKRVYNCTVAVEQLEARLKRLQENPTIKVDSEGFTHDDVYRSSGIKYATGRLV